MTARVGFRLLPATALLALAAVLLSASPAVMPDAFGRGTLPGIDRGALWSRVHVIGASASAGFGVRPPLPRTNPERLRPLGLAEVAAAARIGDGRVSGDATSMFFGNPVAVGRAQVAETMAMEPPPTIVLASDFLFWFTYGARGASGQPSRDEAQRLELLDAGLDALNPIVEAGIPLVVGDLPDMSEAVGRMLARAQMPAPSTLDVANERIRAWASRHPRVAVMALSRLVANLRDGRPFEAGRRIWSEASDGALIQGDRLHPTLSGTVALLASTEQAANDRFLGVRRPRAPGAPEVFEHDPARVSERIRIRAGAARTPAAGARQP